MESLTSKAALPVAYSVCAHLFIVPTDTELAGTLGMPVYRTNVDVIAEVLADHFGDERMSAPQMLYLTPIFSSVLQSLLADKLH